MNVENQAYLEELKHIIFVLNPNVSIQDIVDINTLISTIRVLVDNNEKLSDEMKLYIMGRTNFIDEEIKINKLRKPQFVRYRKPVSVEVILDSELSGVENIIREHLDYNESRRAAGRNAAGNYISD